jgi:hypothetical protein
MARGNFHVVGDASCRLLLIMPCVITFTVMAFRRSALCSLAYFLLAVSAQAQDDSCLRRTIPISVIEKTGSPATGLVAGDLRGVFRRKPVHILSATQDIRPRRIIILLDASGSMMTENQAKWQLALLAATKLVTGAPETEKISLVMFTDQIEGTPDLGERRDSILRRLQEVASGRKAFPKGIRRTAVWDAVLAGALALGPSAFGDAIYLITDGGDNASLEKPSFVERTLLESGVRLFGFFFDERSPLEPGAYGLSDIINLVDDTGGVALTLSPRETDDAWQITPTHTLYASPKEMLSQLDSSIQTQLRHISQFYNLEVALPRKVDKPGDLLLTFARSRDKPWHDRILSYARKFFPCSAAAQAK